MLRFHFSDPSGAAAALRHWLVECALPLWASAGVDAGNGGFHEALTPEGRPCNSPRRLRVQARQVWVYATAAKAGLPGPWLQVATSGAELMLARYSRPDGLFARLADAEGQVVDSSAWLYEQSFAILSLAAMFAAGYERDRMRARAHGLREAMQSLRHRHGGFQELGPHPFQANAHMHLLEAALAWEAAGDGSWASLADEVVELALRAFIHREGCVREFYDASWTPLPEETGGQIEPGHQFEWACLLDDWSRRRGDPVVRACAQRLFECGAKGVDRRRAVAVNTLWQDMRVRDPVARLWPQTERLKAAMVFALEAEILSAARGLVSFLGTPAAGVWRDKMLADGRFVDEPAPATSFYHLMGAILPLLVREGVAPDVTASP